MGKNGMNCDQRTKAETVVVGAGASGCMAAVSAALSGRKVLVIDSNDKIGKKIYATGNGRCNLTNLHMGKDCYHVGGEVDLSAFFARFSERDHIRFWEERGILIHDRQGYVYPGTDQAATVAEAYGKIMRDLGVQVRLSERVTDVRKMSGAGRTGFQIATDRGNLYEADSCILAGGGMAGPQFGCGEEIYRIAKKLGHTVRKPLPALVPLQSDDKTLKAAAGVRCDAGIRLFLDGAQVCSERGELQMTDWGISGIPVFQLSAAAVRALDAGAGVQAVIDFLPGVSDEAWDREIERRMSEDRNCMLGIFYLGLVNRKVLDMVLRRRSLQAENKASKLSEEILVSIMIDMRQFSIVITSAGGFNKAQVTSGGVPLSETDANLQSLKCPGLYLAGELLDVDGICGGYNLQWAATSGWIAGKGAAKEAQRSKDI